MSADRCDPITLRELVDDATADATRALSFFDRLHNSVSSDDMSPDDVRINLARAVDALLCAQDEARALVANGVKPPQPADVFDRTGSRKRNGTAR